MALLAAALNIDPNPNKGVNDPVVTEGSALVASVGPEGTIADIGDVTSGGKISSYVVQEGDTVASVANHFDVSANTIIWANGLNKKSLLKPGTTLIVLPVTGVQHKVTQGETISSLAKKFSADSNEVASYNGMDVTDALTTGDILIIPGGEIATPPTNTRPKKIAKNKKSGIKQGGGLTSIQGNPYKGGSGDEIDGYYSNPVPGGLLTQGIHGWNGVDLGASSGTSVHAAAGGTVLVSRASGWNGGYGNYIVISHGNGTQTLYAHLSSDGVSVGDTVSKGQVIGGVGRTGEATGNHLHFEVRGALNPFANCEVNTHCSPE